MSSLIRTMIMGTPATRRLRATASLLYVPALGAGFALMSSGQTSHQQTIGLMLTGATTALLWRSHLKARAKLETVDHADGCWRALMAGSPDGIMLLAPRLDLNDRLMGWQIVEANGRAHVLFGKDRGGLIARSLVDVLPEEPNAGLYARLATARATSDAPDDALKEPVPKDAAPGGLSHQIMPCEAGIVLVTRDLASTQENAPLPGADTMRLASRIVEETGDAVVVSDALDRIEMVNPAFLNMTGMSPSEVIGKSAELLGLCPLRDSHLPGMAEALLSGQRWSGESRQVCADGRTLDTWLNVNTLRNARQRVTQHIRVFSDISALKDQQRELVEQARHDSLTGLPNRRAFSERLNQAMARARRNPQALAVLFVDLDGFKAVNDQLGHGAGDKVLAEVARRLIDAVRLTDCVCRLAGDEFTVILEGAGHAGEVRRICQRILDRLSLPHEMGSERVQVTPSIGAVVYEDGETMAQLCERADAAMYAAKHAGKARFVMSVAERSGESAPTRVARQGAN
jgi:diguanylate cyclase (GGDEF)-like protein/PAS domain S-box-containing protein